MKRLSLSIFAVFQTLLLHSVLVCGQTFETINFTDGSELKIAVNHIADKKLASKKITSFAILRKQSIFVYESANKAGYSILPGKLTNKILAKHRALFNKIDKATTSYSLGQNGKSFSIDGFDSAKADKLYDCRNCRVKANIVLLKINLHETVYFIPFIESFQVLKTEALDK